MQCWPFLVQPQMVSELEPHSLFDMDGTLVDSVQGVIGAWETFAETYPGIDIPAIMSGGPALSAAYFPHLY
jgi:hypothetical protein